MVGLGGLPKIVHGSLDTATSEIAVNSSLVILILAVIPWRYVWRTYGRSRDRWRWDAPGFGQRTRFTRTMAPAPMMAHIPATAYNTL